MFLKRQLPVYIMVTIGILTLLGHFIKGGFINTFIKEDSLNWFNIIASFAILLGAFNLLKIHFIKFARKQKDWQYSVIALIGFGTMIIAGFFFRGGNYLKIEINSDNIDKLVEVVSDSKYVLNNDFIDSVESYFSNNLISACYGGGANQKLDYFDIDECLENNGLWENRQISPKEFSRPIYNEESSILDDGLSAELKWMIYDYLDELTFLNEYGLPHNLVEDLYDTYAWHRLKAPFITSYHYSYFNCFDYIVDGKVMHKEEGYCQELDYQPITKQLAFIFRFAHDNYKNLKIFPSLKDIASKDIQNKDDIVISKSFNEKSFSYNKLNDMVSDFNKIGLPNFISVESVEWGKHVEEGGTFIKWLFDSIYSPLDTTMFALLAFFVASASYRAFRIRNLEASLLLIAGVLVMLGAIPAGALLPPWFFVYLFAIILFAFIAPLFKDKKILFISLGITFSILFVIALVFDLSFLNSKDIMAWIIKVPTVAGKKAIMIGVALGIVATSLRIIFGRDKSFLGD